MLGGFYIICFLGIFDGWWVVCCSLGGEWYWNCMNDFVNCVVNVGCGLRMWLRLLILVCCIWVIWSVGVLILVLKFFRFLLGCIILWFMICLKGLSFMVNLLMVFCLRVLWIWLLILCWVCRLCLIGCGFFCVLSCVVSVCVISRIGMRFICILNVFWIDFCIILVLLLGFCFWEI